MIDVIKLLEANNNVSDYKINIRKKESYQLFFVKGKLETVRRANNCDKEITVYVNHDEYKGDSEFFIYPSTTEDETKELISKAVAKALLINNMNYELPMNEEGFFEVESNFKDYKASDLAYLISDVVFTSNDIDNASLNSVEVFINKHTDTIINSRGINKTQIKYDAMVEAIPTYNGENESVELYQQYNFGSFDANEVRNEIKEKLLEVKARYEAIKPDFDINCKVIINKLELSELFENIAYDLNYSSVYSQANVFKKDDLIQKNSTGDLINITMKGEAIGNINSSKFDADGMTLSSVKIIEAGKAIVLVVNKWDTISDKDIEMKKWIKDIRNNFQFIPYAPIVFLSAKTKSRIHTLMPEVIKSYESATKEIKTSQLNDCIRDAYMLHMPPSYKGKRLKIYFVNQSGSKPPKFTFNVNNKGLVHFSYERYLENKIRETFDLVGTPIILQFKNKSGE